jgi:hypothetical protein
VAKEANLIYQFHVEQLHLLMKGLIKPPEHLEVVVVVCVAQQLELKK